MAKNITLLGASYSNVPAVQLPQTGGGTARFDDASVTTATASDVASGKVFLAADGTITTGTSSGGGGISIDDLAQNLQPSGAITLGSGVTRIENYAFAGKPITNIYGANVAVLGTNAFIGTQITSLTDSNFPKLGVDAQYTILLRLPTACTSIKFTGERIALSSGSGALRDNTGLVSAEFPNASVNVGASVVGMGNSCFYGCTNLELVDIGYCNSIGGTAFYNDKKHITLIMRKSDALVTLGNKANFNNSCFANGQVGGTIYIPKVLYDHLGDNSSLDYQHATNWSTIHGYGTITWAKIEGSIYE